MHWLEIRKTYKGKTIKIISLVLTFVLVVGALVFFLINKKDDKPTLGVWWWKDELDQSYSDFAVEQGVTEIYYCSSKFNNETDKFVEKANKKHISVFWLAGEYE